MARKLKTGSSRLKTAPTAENVERVTNDSIRRSVRASSVRAAFCPTATSFALRFRSTHVSTLMFQFYGAELLVFSSKFGNNS